MAPATSPVPELEVWVDAHTQHLIDVDVLDYPGACEAADKAVIEAQDRHPLDVLSNAPGRVIEYNGLNPAAVHALQMNMRADYARKLNQPGRQVIMPRGYGQQGRAFYELKQANLRKAHKAAQDYLQQQAWEDAKELGIV